MIHAKAHSLDDLEPRPARTQALSSRCHYPSTFCPPADYTLTPGGGTVEGSVGNVGDYTFRRADR
ncbi:MAG: hypothetical protein M3Q76_04165 [Acidobacteriota bacterium]|nr:hypothetical protein [Acidobacteriota bacterium]